MASHDLSEGHRPPAIDRSRTAARGGSIGLVLLVALALVGAAVGLLLAVASGWTAPAGGPLGWTLPGLLVGALVGGLLALPVPTATAEPGVDRARAEAARIRAEVDRLRVRVEVMAQAYAETDDRLQGALRSALAHQRALDDQELAVETAQARLGDQVRGIYEVGPLVSAELLLLADEPHELALAVHVAGASLTTSVHDVDRAAATQARDQALVAELRAAAGELAGRPAAAGTPQAGRL
jgi:hypothetical protein